MSRRQDRPMPDRDESSAELRARKAGFADPIEDPIGDRVASSSPSRTTLTGAAATGAQSVGALAVGALAFGALALGAVAVGAFAIGRLSVGRAAIREARFGRLQIDELSIGRIDETGPDDRPT